MERIKSQADLDAGVALLGAQDPLVKEGLELTGPLPLRARDDGFEALLQAIVSQQISVAAARSIWARLEGAGFTQEAALRAADAEALRGCGLSRPKIRYAQALALAQIDYTALRAAPDAEVLAVLTAVPGIGRWTAEIYLLFSLGRVDVFPAADLALQEAARALLGLEERPSERAIREIAATRWAPYRSLAARFLWAYYRCDKNREGIAL